MKNPAASIIMKNGAKIVLELLPENAPNTVKSFLYGVRHHVYDHHEIERIVPGSWIDLSYSAFHCEAAKYLIPPEQKVSPQAHLLPVTEGTVAMGGYGELGLAGCEIFFPLRDCPELTGTYPVFGIVREGLEELHRLEKEETLPVTDYPYPDVIINRPVRPQIIDHVELELFGAEYADPERVDHHELPLCWKELS